MERSVVNGLDIEVGQEVGPATADTHAFVSMSTMETVAKRTVFPDLQDRQRNLRPRFQPGDWSQSISRRPTSP